MEWPVPDELPALAVGSGEARTLDTYVRPGLGGAPTVLWIASERGEVSTWAGHDAPWRDDGCADGCYAVAAPLGALQALAEDLEVPSPPALLAMGADVRAGTVLELARAVESAGLEAHVVVSPDGRPPVGGSQVPTVHVLRLDPSAPEGCAVAFHPVQTWSDVLATLPGCTTVGLRPLAPNAPASTEGRATSWLIDEALSRTASSTGHTCAASLTGLTQEDGVPANAVRPALGRAGRIGELRDVARCAETGPASGPLHVGLALRDGVPSEVDGRVGPGGVAPPKVLECLQAALSDWRFSAEASGRVELELEVVCTPRG